MKDKVLEQMMFAAEQEVTPAEGPLGVTINALADALADACPTDRVELLSRWVATLRQIKNTHATTQKDLARGRQTVQVQRTVDEQEATPEVLAAHMRHEQQAMLGRALMDGIQSGHWYGVRCREMIRADMISGHFTTTTRTMSLDVTPIDGGTLDLKTE